MRLNSEQMMFLLERRDEIHSKIMCCVFSQYTCYDFFFFFLKKVENRMKENETFN